MNKTVLALAALLTAHTSGNAQMAKHSDFTTKQLAEHLGLSGGNWVAEFDEKVFCGFVITETNAEGKPVTSYNWSPDPSRNHSFTFMHHIEKRMRTNDLHNVSCSSVQEGEWEKDVKIKTLRTKYSLGIGFGYHTTLPNGGASKQQKWQGGGRIEKDVPQILYSWSSKETKTALSVEIVFTADKDKVEANGKKDAK